MVYLFDHYYYYYYNYYYYHYVIDATMEQFLKETKLRE